MASATLTHHDSSILTALFDPESAHSKGTLVDPNTASLPHIAEEIFSSLRVEEQAILKPLDLESPSASAVREAIDGLTTLIQTNPQYPSAYTNRAQATRLEIKLDDLFTSEHQEASQRLLGDLGDAIRLATPAMSTAPISQHQASVLAAAHTHRGLLLLRIADLKTNDVRPQGIGEKLDELEPKQVEELASKDFFMGGRYGNRTAQQMSVKTNPYAKMCGEIVKEALQKEIAESRQLAELGC